MNRLSLNVLIVGLSAVLTACSSPPQRVEHISYAPSYPLDIPKPPQPNNGSLFQDGAMTLFDDSRAHRVGDIITIQLTESISANKKDEAKYNKSNSQDYGITTPISVTTPNNLIGKAINGVTSPIQGLGIGYGSNGAFSGKSDVKQNSSLDGSIAVTVVEVISNGNLVIRGEKWITIHDGDEVVQFAGIIRPEDIQPDNTISSTKVADVRLVYKDVGMTGDNARAGVASQWLSKYWPF
ncbi:MULTISPECIES: flagellar basal body L-ring protein FlgH [Thiomicrorhabdus]|uniref:Flagellar L-ring protein n=1 Tax=Thiomicrorhabdus heinhorstiae TaxID=2748010 RepID=A0ABS0C0A4_9GAMM|nr:MULTISPECIES: flagellar basal body L-ring protein FlgH [Thiomicrorhabdus]MBF6058679.1 flagellar basal body L-ring protein FlgH [Thiomicrorhabdus heinhorstiae]